ncbi:MAG: type II toxin-antitoxin system HipA family toxin [Balneolaceae bacterium]|nr:MAG: type II toxin-antitoxin system HipA family toxin [Balneolaceae bacterium]
MNRCLICTGETPDPSQYHPNCLKKLFGSREKPELDIRSEQLQQLAKKTVYQRVTVPGVQSKLSLEVERKARSTSKLTIVGFWGRFILKPPSEKWPELPENEHCTMRMAEVAGIETVPFGLIHLASGERAYITKRVDRDDEGRKFAMEDMCQLSGRLTEDKYKGSHEQIARIVRKFSENPLFDLTRYFELVLFSYLTGNGDMHLKNFSLLRDPEFGWKLAPAYDLLSTRLVIPEDKDPEELALTLTGKKSNFKMDAFMEFGKSIGLKRKQVTKLIDNLVSERDELLETIENSFLSGEKKEQYRTILTKRFVSVTK